MIAHINDAGMKQTVRDHCINVAEYASKEAASIGLSKTLYLTGLLHDMGKNTNEFNTYIQEVHNGKYRRRGEVNHSSAGARYLYECNVDVQGIEKLTSELISCAVFSHHGLVDLLIDGKDGFCNRIYPDKNNYYEEAVKNSTDFLNNVDVKKLFSESVNEIARYYNSIKYISESMYNIMKDNGDCQSKQNYTKQYFFFLVGCLQRMILSILVDADRRDTSEFMSGSKEIRLTMKEIIPKWNVYSDRLEKRLQQFSSDSEIAHMRSLLSNECLEFAKNGDGIYRLSIPTGGGKTLSSFRYALELSKRTKKKHIYYIAPFLSILEQNAKEIKEIFNDDSCVLEHHSNVIIEEMQDNMKEDLYERELLVDSWSAPIILTTMVQFLNTLFSGQMSAVRRTHQLKDSVIIIDEAQAIPVKCMNLFTTFMNFLNHCCNTTIVLCTATQPLFESIRCPILFSEKNNIIFDTLYYEQKFKRVQIEYKKDSMTTEQLATFCLEKLCNNMLIILNTKRAVQSLYNYMKECILEDIELVQLTTYMCAAHRLDVIQSLKNQLHRKRIICISTQLIEAGVDISFETVIRSLAGMDSIAQAAGRCNRNGELDEGSVYVINYEEENTDQLKDIQKGKRASKAVFDYYNEDFLSSQALSLYYRQYYWNRYDEMDFIAKKNNLYKLLSYNNDLIKDYYSITGKRFLHCCSNLYRTAGKLFHVIDEQDTIGLIVPYRHAITDIELLMNESNISERLKILKELQRYTVNMYIHDSKIKEIIERQAVTFVHESFYVLDSDYYDSNGVTTDLTSLIF